MAKPPTYGIRVKPLQYDEGQVPPSLVVFTVRESVLPILDYPQRMSRFEALAQEVLEKTTRLRMPRLDIKASQSATVISLVVSDHAAEIMESQRAHIIDELNRIAKVCKQKNAPTSAPAPNYVPYRPESHGKTRPVTHDDVQQVLEPQEQQRSPQAPPRDDGALHHLLEGASIFTLVNIIGLMVDGIASANDVRIICWILGSAMLITFLTVVIVEAKTEASSLHEAVATLGFVAYSVASLIGAAIATFTALHCIGIGIAAVVALLIGAIASFWG